MEPDIKLVEDITGVICPEDAWLEMAILIIYSNQSHVDDPVYHGVNLLGQAKPYFK